MKIFLEQHQCPGDILMLTAAVRDLKAAYPSIRVGVDTTTIELWHNNPNIDWTVNKHNADRAMEMEYPLIHQSDRLPYHFVHAFRKELELQLGLRIPQGPFKGDIYLSPDERRPLMLLGNIKNYWIMDAGFKNDYTLKFWGHSRFCKVVELLKDKVTFVQVGLTEPTHKHAPIPGAIDLVGKTNVREFIRLMYHASGVLTPVSFPMHLSAAVPTPDGRLRPCIVLNGGREPPSWVQYPGHIFLQNVGMLDCCRSGGCWRSRGKRLGDGASSDFSICAHPIMDGDDAVGKCMAMIEPEYVAKLIEMYQENR